MSAKKNTKVKTTAKKRDFSKLIPWIAGIGLVLTIELIVVYFKANFIDGASPSFCAINSTIDCDAVAKTNFALLFGVPNAIWGFLFYAFVLVLYYAKKLKEIKLFKFMEVFEHPKSYIFLLSLLILLADIILAFISTAVIQKICLVCFITYFVNFLLVIIAKPSKSFSDIIITTINDFIKAISNKVYAIAFFLVVTLGIGTLIYLENSKLFFPPESSIFAVNLEEYQPSVTNNELGDTKATVVINEFTDIQCPYCAMSNKMVNKIVEDYDNVRVIHHDFPLDRDCNPLLQEVNAQMHPNSCLFAQYALAAKKQNKGWGLVNLMFKNNQTLTEAQILELAKGLGMNADTLKKDAYSEEIKNTLKEDIQLAIDMEINATPTYMINGKKHSGLNYIELSKIVKENGGVLKQK